VPRIYSVIWKHVYITFSDIHICVVALRPSFIRNVRLILRDKTSFGGPLDQVTHTQLCFCAASTPLELEAFFNSNANAFASVPKSGAVQLDVICSGSILLKCDYERFGSVCGLVGLISTRLVLFRSIKINRALLNTTVCYFRKNFSDVVMLRRN
jgi:hypothetical protein